MALKHKTHDVERAVVVQRSPKQTAHTENEFEHVSPPVSAWERIVTKPPATFRPADIVTLQRTVGNRVVQRMLSQSRSLSSSRSMRTIQRQTEQEEPLQRKSDNGARAENKTGLPDRLKTGIENLSGLSLDDVRVHRNSSRPAELQALAYTQGQDIHLGPGQEKHLPHEAWHVVQQKQGRVTPTLQEKGLPINDDECFEREADVMGARARNSAESVQTSQPTAQPQPSSEGDPAKIIQTKPVLQLMNLEQAKLNTGLTKDNFTLPLVEESPRLVNQYYQAAAGDSTSKLEALQEAGKMNAKIGGLTEKSTWTLKSEKLNDEKNPSLDPFLYRVEVPYTLGSDKHTLGLSFQHASRFTGYVVWITDSSSKAAAKWVEMYEAEYDNTGKLKKPVKDTQKFHNIHDTTDTSKIIDLTAGDKEESLDAYTKIAGEGARWKCVRNHAAHLTNKSYFFTRIPNTNQAWAISFHTLWLSWASDFGKRYDIADSEVKATILKSGTSLYKNAQQGYVADLGSNDYDLDNEKSYVKPVVVTPAPKQSVTPPAPTVTNAIVNKK